MAKPVIERTREYLGRHLYPPEVTPLPGGGGVMTAPAKFKFPGEHAVERERLARACARASGIVPDPDQLTAEVMAALEAAGEEQA